MLFFTEDRKTVSTEGRKTQKHFKVLFCIKDIFWWCSMGLDNFKADSARALDKKVREEARDKPDFELTKPSAH